MYRNAIDIIMFIFIFVSPLVPNLYTIKANHEISMFILSKKTFIIMKKFHDNLKAKINIMNLP